MNIIEALKEAITTGRRFRRKDWEDGDEWETIESWFDGHCLISELKADDWEIEPTTVKVTRKQLNEAWYEAFGCNEPYCDLSFDLLAKELGL